MNTEIEVGDEVIIRCKVTETIPGSPFITCQSVDTQGNKIGPNPFAIYRSRVSQVIKAPKIPAVGSFWRLKSDDHKVFKYQILYADAFGVYFQCHDSDGPLVKRSQWVYEAFMKDFTEITDEG